MEHPAWTPERMDDLSRRMDAGFERVDREMDIRFERVDREMAAGFDRVDRDIRELRTEMGAVRADVNGLRTEMMRFGAGLFVTMLAVIVTSLLGG